MRSCWVGALMGASLSGCVVIVDTPPPLVIPIVVKSPEVNTTVMVDQQTIAPEPLPQPPVVERVLVPESVSAPDADHTTCSFYDQPPFPPIPEIARPESIDTLSYQESEALLVEHILQLRHYISEVRAEYEEAYRQYLQDC